MGIRSCPATELVFDGCAVSAADRLGDEGDGYRIALSALGEGAIRSRQRASGWHGRGSRRRRATSGP